MVDYDWDLFCTDTNMKCCGVSYQKNSDICSSCGGLAIFSQYQISQERWMKSIERVSCGGLYHFTQTQIFADFLDEKSTSIDLYRLTLVFFVFGQMMLPLTGIVCSLIVAALLFFLPTNRHVVGVCVVLFFILGMGLWFSSGVAAILQIPALICVTLCLRYEPILLVSFGDIQKIQKVWFASYPNDRFIEESKLGLRSFIPEEADGILLVDQDILVDFFVWNGFIEQMNFAVLSTKQLPLVARLPRKEVFFLHGSGDHISSIRKAISLVDIGWKEDELSSHPSFREFIQKSQLPVDLLSPKELVDSTRYAIEHRVGVLDYFEQS